MGIFDGCLLASDIDGTLFLKGKIPEINIEKIDWFKSEGGIFTLSTGRTVTAAKPIYDLSHANAPVITFHGGAIYDYNNKEFIYHKILPSSARKVLREIMDTFPEIGVEIHSGLDLYEARGNRITDYHVEYESLFYAPIPENVEQALWTKIFFGVEDEETLESLAKFCKQFEGCGCRFMVTQNIENARYFEIVPEDVNKGAALMFLKRKFGCHTAFGIGDYFNDIELVRDADVGAATAQAPEELKALADYITRPCKDGAVADFIDNIALRWIRPKS